MPYDVSEKPLRLKPTQEQLPGVLIQELPKA